MLKQKRATLVSALILLLFLAIVSFSSWARSAPKKPDPIPPGDYAYTVDYVEYRIDQLIKQRHLPSVAVALIDDQDTIWQQAFGLADLLQLSIDLRELEIEFLAEDNDVMIINMGGIVYEICPRYPEFTDIPALWKELAGVYELSARLPSGNVASEII